MLHSLRFRLLIATLLIVLVTVSVMAVFASQRTAGEFRSYVEHSDRTRQRRFEFALTRAYAQTRTWQNIQPVIEEWEQVRITGTGHISAIESRPNNFSRIRRCVQQGAIPYVVQQWILFVE